MNTLTFRYAFTTLALCLATSIGCAQRDVSMAKRLPSPSTAVSAAPVSAASPAKAPSAAPVASVAPVAAAPAVAFRSSRGRIAGVSWAAVSVDPRRAWVDVAVFGRGEKGWNADYAAVDALPDSCQVAINGTFFSIRDREPVGILVYDQGQAEWNPRVKRWYGDEEREVVRLSRCYLAILDDGTPRIGNSEGRLVGEVRAVLERDTGRHVRCLMGGCGPLVSEGRSAVQAERLARAGFDGLSGLREGEPCRRSGVGVTTDGRLLLLTCGLEGGGLSLDAFARLFIEKGAQEAIFLDCGSSTAMRQQDGWGRGGRPVPVWLVARRR